MKSIIQLKREITKWKKMFKEEEGSLWASEHETYMEDKRILIRDLELKLKTLKEVLEFINTLDMIAENSEKEISRNEFVNELKQKIEG